MDLAFFGQVLYQTHVDNVLLADKEKTLCLKVQKFALYRGADLPMFSNDLSNFISEDTIRINLLMIFGSL